MVHTVNMPDQPRAAGVGMLRRLPGPHPLRSQLSTQAAGLGLVRGGGCRGGFLQRSLVGSHGLELLRDQTCLCPGGVHAGTQRSSATGFRTRSFQAEDMVVVKSTMGSNAEQRHNAHLELPAQRVQLHALGRRNRPLQPRRL